MTSERTPPQLVGFVPGMEWRVEVTEKGWRGSLTLYAVENGQALTSYSYRGFDQLKRNVRRKFVRRGLTIR